MKQEHGTQTISKDWLLTDKYIDEMEEEIWKDVVGWESLYEVSNLGRIRRLPRLQFNHIRYLHSTKDTKYGYCRVMFCRDNKPKRYLVHRLVAEAFIPNPDNKPCVDHINRCRSDNRASNLRWCTHKENNNFDETRKCMSESHIALHKTARGKELKKLYKERSSKAVIVKNKDGSVFGVFSSGMDAAKATGYTNHTISKACKGKLITQQFDFEFA